MCILLNRASESGLRLFLDKIKQLCCVKSLRQVLQLVGWECLRFEVEKDLSKRNVRGIK
jgi:hypothetical protein